jgi:hypothetical protein
MLEDTGAPTNIYFNTGAPCDVVEMIHQILAERSFDVRRIDNGRIRHAVLAEAHIEQALAALLIGADAQRNPTGGGRDFAG